MGENKVDYYHFLLDAIPSLKYAKSIGGSEGRAYFLTDEFVVKEYTNSDDWGLFDMVFERYCKELQTLSNAGFALPKIHTYVKIPNIEFYTKGSKNKFRYYILEENVKGRPLYYGYLEDAYALVCDVCSKQEFKSVARKIETGDFEASNKALVSEVLTRFFKDYIQMNEMLEAMSETELSRFLTNAKHMYANGEYSYPDMFPHNILTDMNTLTMIDPHIKTGVMENPSGDFSSDLVSLFLYNYFVNNPTDAAVVEMVMQNPELAKLSMTNEKLSAEVLKRVLGLVEKEEKGFLKNAGNKNKIVVFTALSSIFSDKKNIDDVFEKFM